jgi:hypothetical protein
MKPPFPLSNKAWLAVFLVAGLLAVFAIYSREIVIPVTAFCTAGIAAFDSGHVGLRRYKTELAYGPVGLFVVCALMWPFCVIWYFVLRVRIARGTLPLRDEVEYRHHA